MTQRPLRGGVVLAAVALPIFLAAADPPLLALAASGIAMDLGDAAQAHWVAASYPIASVFSAWLAGRLGDRIGHEKVLGAALLLYAIAATGSAAASSAGSLVTWRALQGLGGGGFIVLAQGYVGQRIPGRSRPRFQGRLGLVFAAANLIGLFGGALLIAQLGWRSLFVCQLALSLLAALLLHGLPRPIVLPDGAGRRSQAPSGLWRTRGMWWASLCVAGFSSALFFVLVLAPRLYGGDAAWWIVLPMALGLSAGSWLAGRLARPERFDGLLCCKGLCLSAAVLLVLSSDPQGGLQVALAAACALGFGTVMPTAQLMGQALAGGRRLGAAATWVTLSRAAGAALGAWAAGVAASSSWWGHPHQALLVAATAAGCAAFAATRLPRVDLTANEAMR